MFNVPMDHLAVSHIKMLLDEHPQLNKVILSSVKPSDEELKHFLAEDVRLKAFWYDLQLNDPLEH